MSSDEKRSNESRELYQDDLDRHLFAFGDRPRKLANLSESSVAARIADLLERLPALYREVLQLRLRRGLKYDEIAEQLEVPIGTVKSRMFRAREKLDRLLEELEEMEELERDDPSGSGAGSGG